MKIRYFLFPKGYFELKIKCYCPHLAKIQEMKVYSNLESSSPGEFHPQALTEPDVTVSRHPALIIPPPIQRLCLTPWLLPSLVDQTIRPDDPTPSLHLHYRDFNTTTSWSAPVPRIGTLTLMGSSHLSFSLSIEDDRFPRSTQEPGSGSRHLYAGRRPSSKQVTLGLILEFSKPPVLTSSFSFRHLINGSLALVSLNLT